MYDKKGKFEWLDNEDDHKKWGIVVEPSKLLNNKELGLYATRNFENNEKIAPYLGEELTVEQRQYRYGKLWGPYIYFKPWGHPSIDAQFYRGAAAFANDGSWIPLNDLEYMPRDKNLSNARLERGYLVADQNIKKGEEILLNYGENYWKRRFTGPIIKGSWNPQILKKDDFKQLKKSVQIGGMKKQVEDERNMKKSYKLLELERKLNELTKVERRGNIYFKRDDLFNYAGVQGGKVRTCLAYVLEHLKNNQIKGVITGGSRSSPQVQIVGKLATNLGLNARLHLPKGELPIYIQEACKDHIVKQWFPGYNHVISARVHEDTTTLNKSYNDWLEIPFGMEVSEAIDLTAEQVKNLPFDSIKRIVMAVGSGMSLAGVIEGLKRYNPKFLGNKEILGVVVGQDPSKRLDKWFKLYNTNKKEDWRDYVELVKSNIDYHDMAAVTTFKGINLDPIYEAKTIPFLRDGDLLWIIGHR